ncbi:unnamed protein product [Heterobilharzia americana]|nr:unnamed protein product [Heterobilharzia americana]
MLAVKLYCEMGLHLSSARHKPVVSQANKKYEFSAGEYKKIDHTEVTNTNARDHSHEDQLKSLFPENRTHKVLSEQKVHEWLLKNKQHYIVIPKDMTEILNIFAPKQNDFKTLRSLGESVKNFPISGITSLKSSKLSGVLNPIQKTMCRYIEPVNEMPTFLNSPKPIKSLQKFVSVWINSPENYLHKRSSYLVSCTVTDDFVTFYCVYLSPSVDESLDGYLFELCHRIYYRWSLWIKLFTAINKY